MGSESHGNTVEVCVYRESLDHWREDHGLPPTYNEKADDNLAYLAVPEKAMQEYLHDTDRNSETFSREYTADDTTDFVDWLDSHHYSIKEAKEMANEKQEISPEVKDAITNINQEILAQTAAGQAIFQQGKEAIEASHAPMLVYGKYTGQKEVNGKSIPTFDETNFKAAAFTGGAAVYLSTLGLKDPRFMPAREAYFSKDVKVAKSPTVYLIPTYDKKKNVSRVQKFINFADLTGPVIEKDFSKAVNPKLDTIHQGVLKTFAAREHINKPYEAAYYVHRDVVKFLSEKAEKTAAPEKAAEAKAAPKKAAAKAKNPEAAAKKEAYKKDCAPFLAEFHKREEAVKNYQGAPLTPESLPQDRFMQVMHDSMGKTNKEGKPLSYAYLATKALYEAKVPKDQIVACINNLAPESAKDPARMKAYGTKYADFLTNRVEKSKSYQAKKQAAAAR